MVNTKADFYKEHYTETSTKGTRLRSELNTLLGQYEAIAAEDKCDCNEDNDVVYTCKYCQIAGLLNEIGSILRENIDLLA